MSASERLAAWDRRLRPFAHLLPSDVAIGLYSRGRRTFLKSFGKAPTARDPEPFVPDPSLARTLWGLHFRLPILNAAGMFKNGEAYQVVARQGAGAYLAGTTTGRSRKGNCEHRARWPFVPYGRSGAASNFLGLPNLGHGAVAERLQQLPRHEGFPLGVSLAFDPGKGLTDDEKLKLLVAGLQRYAAAGVDFIEINESCPNTEDASTGKSDDVMDALKRRLGHLDKEFLRQRDRRLPVLVKLSCDTDPELVDGLVEQLIERGFDGVNFGNTSVDYARHREALVPAERRLFDRFSKRFGGGLSGRPLKQDSLRLCEQAVERVEALGSSKAFHVVRTGGIEDAADVRRSLDAGVALCQWYTGYFEAFAQHGHRLYAELAKGLQ